MVLDCLCWDSSPRLCTVSSSRPHLVWLCVVIPGPRVVILRKKWGRSISGWGYEPCAQSLFRACPTDVKWLLTGVWLKETKELLGVGEEGASSPRESLGRGPDLLFCLVNNPQRGSLSLTPPTDQLILQQHTKTSTCGFYLIYLPLWILLS